MSGEGWETAQGMGALCSDGKDLRSLRGEASEPLRTNRRAAVSEIKASAPAVHSRRDGWVESARTFVVKSCRRLWSFCSRLQTLALIKLAQLGFREA